MHPLLFHWKFLSLHTYGLFAALAVLAGHGFTVAWARRRGMDAAAVSDSLPALVVGGLLGGRALYALVHWSEFAGAPLDVLKIWQGGLMWHGGVIGGVSAAAFHFRRRGMPVRAWADLFSPGLALGQSLGRVGCFFAGCCYGRACDFPWAVRFTDPASLAPLGLPLHPSQLYDAGWNVLLFLGLWRLARRPFWSPGPGRLAALYLALSALGRWAVELTRGDDRGRLWGSVTVTQGLSLAAAAIVGAWLLKRRNA